MKQKRDWMDYAGLASDVAQNIQLGGIKNTLVELQKSEARKQANEEHLASFRANLLEQEDQLDTLQKTRASFGPESFFIRVITIQKILEHWGRMHFRSISYDDKDRWRALNVRIEAAREEIEKDLPPNTAADLEKALDYSASLPIMEANIEYGKKKDAFLAAKSKLDSLTSRTAPFKTTRNVLAWIAFFIGMSIGFCIFSRNNGIFAAGPAFLCCMAAYAACGLHPTAKLCSQREKAYWEVSRVQTEFTVLPTDQNRGKPVAEQIKDYTECIAFINRVSGEDPILPKFTN